MITITTLHRLHEWLGVQSATDDARLLHAIQAASAQVERRTGRTFTPYQCGPRPSE